MDTTLTSAVIFRELRLMKPDLQRRFGVLRIGLFGSFVRGDAQPGSDIDLLVEMDAPTFGAYMDVKFLLEDRFGRPVDLVLTDSLKPRLKPLVLDEVVYA